MPKRVTRFIPAKLCLTSAGVFILIQEREDKRISLNYIENYYGEFFQPGGRRYLVSRPTKARHRILEGCRILLHQCVPMSIGSSSIYVLAAQGPYVAFQLRFSIIAENMIGLTVVRVHPFW